MRLRHVIIFAPLLALLPVPAGCCRRGAPAAAPGSPNIILLLVDALRPDHLGSYGYHRDTSPFLDGLAARSVVFDTAITPSTWTKTVVPALWSSLYPEAHGVRGMFDVLSDDILLLPEILHERGYRTGCVTGNPWMEEKFGFKQGFDDFLCIDFTNRTMRADAVNKRALACLERLTKPRLPLLHRRGPFFLYVHYMDVHLPYEPPAEFDVFGKTDMDKYDGTIRFIDHELGNLFRRLEGGGYLSNTWVVILADHGEEFGEHGGTEHGCGLYDEVLKVPLFFHHPGLTSAGGRIGRQVRLIDVTPTLLDLAGLPIPARMDGVSLKANVLEPGAAAGEDLEAFSQVGLNDRIPDQDYLSIRTPGMKYILERKTGREQLFDLKADPAERRNIAAKRAKIIEKLREKALQFTAAESAKKPGAVEQKDLDESRKEQLRSLGYLR